MPYTRMAIPLRYIATGEGYVRQQIINMRSPIRRSKKIGLTQGGRVWDGKPYEKWSRLFPLSTWEKISIENQALQIMRENPSKNYFHPCSANQINFVLDQLPNELISGIRAIILRRISKMDQQRLVDARKTFRCIILNSFNVE